MLMDWTSDNEGQTYTAQQDTCQALVWRTQPGEWRARVSWAGSAVGQVDFATLEAAQAWCEAEVAELTAAGWCTSD